MDTMHEDNGPATGWGLVGNVKFPRLDIYFISGIVVCSACTHLLLPWQSLLLGLISGPCYIFTRKLVIKLCIDDPLDVISVHFIPGLLGLVLGPLINPYGPFYHGNPNSGWHVAWNVAGGFTLVLWSAGLSFILFGILAAFKKLSLDAEEQVRGFDEHLMREQSELFLRGKQ